MSNTAGWVGGEHFKAQQWGCGATHSGEGAKKYGNAGAKRNGVYRFNPNPTRSSHAGCQIAIQSRRDKERYINSQKEKANV